MDTEVLIAPYGIDPDNNAYQPNPTQLKVLHWVDNVKVQEVKDFIPVLYLQGGVGSGKSRAILAVVLELLFEFPGLRVFWGRQDFKDIKLSIMDKFFEIIPPSLIVGQSAQYSWYDIRTRDEKRPSRIYFGGLKDLSGLGSQEFGVIAVTEAHETTEMAYRTLKRRCRQANAPNMIFIESEPPNEDHWLSRLTDSSKDEYDKDIEKWELSTYENWENLPQAYRGSLESMPKSWQRKYLYGKCGFIPDGRPFYEGFKEQVHAFDLQFNPNRDLILSWDFGFHHPAVSFHQLDEVYWNVLKELMGSEVTIQAFCKQVQSFVNTNFPDAKIINYGDPACLQTNDKSEKTSWQICKENGFTLTCRQSTYRLRKEIIDKKLSTMVNGKPTLRVDRSCKTIIDGFLGGYHYPERNPGQSNTATFDQPFRDGFYEHLLNTVEYMAINVFKAVETRPRPKQYTDIVHRLSNKNNEVAHNAGIGY